MSGYFSTTLSFADYLAANLLLLRRRWLWRGVARFVAILAPVYFVLGLLGEPWARLSDQGVLAIVALVALAITLGALALFALLSVWQVRRAARKSYAQMQIEGLETRFAFSATGLEASNPLGTSTLTWSHFCKFAENERLLLLMRTEMMFFPIPKAQVAESVLADLRACALAAGVPRW